MPVCSPNTSRPRAGAALATFLTQTATQTIVARYGGNWLALLSQVMSPLYSFDLTALCAVDPPADPGVTAADIASVIALGRGPLTSAAADRIDQLVTRFAWYALCECSGTGGLPTPPAFPTAPAGLPAVDPPAQVGASANVCGVFDFTFTWASLGFQRTAKLPIPVGATSVAYDHSFTPYLGTGTFGAASTFTFFPDNTGGAFISSSGMNASASPPHQHGTITIPSTAHYFTVEMGDNGDHVAGTDQMELQFNCGAGTGILGGSSCLDCPPDPVLAGQINSILQLVTLLQRQQVPFAYIGGTAHHTLTGSGSIAVQGILGVLLNVSIPASYGVEVGTPDTVFDLGYLRFGTADGYAPAVRIDTDSQVVFPDSAGLYTLVAYSLSPGVSMTMTELVRES